MISEFNLQDFEAKVMRPMMINQISSGAMDNILHLFDGEFFEGWLKLSPDVEQAFKDRIKYLKKYWPEFKNPSNAIVKAKYEN